jgi:FMN phosphatase YigB (HAD superfamily)/glycerophosphoryl diester phosphodiesterase
VPDTEPAAEPVAQPVGRHPILAFAHRGGVDGGHPENSLAAFGDALARGAHPESDVRLSLDRQPMLVHDLFSRRRGVPVASAVLPAALLARLGIPRLADLYRSLGTDFELSLDLKERRAWPATLAVARRFGAVDRLWLVHDDLDLLIAIRAADPDVRLVHEARPQVLARGGWDLVDHAARLGSHGIDAQNTRAAAWSSEALAAAHRHRVAAFGSIVEGGPAQRAAAAKGLDALYTDHPADLVAAIEAAGAAVARRGPVRRAGDRAIDGVLFDFGYTLLGHPPGVEVLRAAAAELGHPLSVAEAADLWDEIHAAAMDPAEVARGRDLDAGVWAARWKVIYGRADRVVPGLGDALDRSFHGGGWVPYADTARVLEALHRAGVRVGVLSNTGWDIAAALRAHGLDRWIDAVVRSCDVGAVKPDPAIFAAGCAAIGTDPARTLMVGDDPDADPGAVAAGLADVVLVDGAAPVGGDNGLAGVLDRVLGPTR